MKSLSMPSQFQLCGRRRGSHVETADSASIENLLKRPHLLLGCSRERVKKSEEFRQSEPNFIRSAQSHPQSVRSIRQSTYQDNSGSKKNTHFSEELTPNGILDARKILNSFFMGKQWLRPHLLNPVPRPLNCVQIQITETTCQKNHALDSPLV